MLLWRLFVVLLYFALFAGAEDGSTVNRCEGICVERSWGKLIRSASALLSRGRRLITFGNYRTSMSQIEAATYLVYITVPEVDLATTMSRQLVEERLAACVNILPGARSIYSWEGKIEESSEVVMLAKTSRPDALRVRVMQLHPYDVPCVISIPIEGGNPQFLEWVNANSSPKPLIE